jgi:hypothetical protein
MSFGVVTSTSPTPGFVTDVDNRTIGRFKVKLPYCEGNAVEFLLVTIYSPKTLQPREWFSTHLMA